MYLEKRYVWVWIQIIGSIVFLLVLIKGLETASKILGLSLIVILAAALYIACRKRKRRQPD